MDCHQAREQLNAYLDGELGEFETRQVAAHVESCQSCRHELEAYRGTRDIMRQFGPAPSPPHMAESIRIVMEKERLIPRRGRISSTISQARFPRVNRLALAATFLLAMLAGGSWFVYDNAGKFLAGKQQAKTSSRAAVAEKAQKLTLENTGNAVAPPETLSMELAEAPLADADLASPDSEMDEDSDISSETRRARAVSQATRSARETMALGRGTAPRPAPPAAPRAAARRGFAATDSLDILVAESPSPGRASGGGPGALPAPGDDGVMAAKPFSEAKAMLRELEYGNAPEGIAWNIADRFESSPAISASRAAEAEEATLGATARAPVRMKSAAADKGAKADDKKAKPPALNIILKARSGQPHAQQQAILKQLKPHLDSGAAQIQNGKLVLNMTADETLVILQSINEEQAGSASVPVPEKMLKNEIAKPEPRIVNTEIIFVSDDSAPATATPAADSE